MKVMVVKRAGCEGTGSNQERSKRGGGHVKVLQRMVVKRGGCEGIVEDGSQERWM